MKYLSSDFSSISAQKVMTCNTACSYKGVTNYTKEVKSAKHGEVIKRQILQKNQANKGRLGKKTLTLYI